MSMALDEGTNDSVLIEDETKELKEILAYHSQRKSELILEAAKKLEDKYEDRSVIASRLKKEWQGLDITPRYIELQLPAQYKRSYKTEKITKGKVNEYISRLQKLHTTIASIYSKWNKALKDPKREQTIIKAIEEAHAMHANQHKELEDLMTRMRSIAHFSDLLEFVKILEIEADSLQNLMDERLKFSLAWKLTLKCILVYQSYDHVSSQVAHSKQHGAKWLSKIDHNSELEQFFRNTAKCPSCGWDWEIWMEKARHAQLKGLEIPQIS